MLHPIPGGAAARPCYPSQHVTYGSFLRIAPELYLKRLVIGDLNVFMKLIETLEMKEFKRHNPEFLCLNFYMAHQDYHFMMDFVEIMIKNVITKHVIRMLFLLETKSLILVSHLHV